MKKLSPSQPLTPRDQLDSALTDRVFVKGLRAFEAQALLARRGFEAGMATRSFGAGSSLDNDPSKR
ncbi:hypothetical protein WBQ28_04645 [Pseudomonas syringae pv. syringae]|uniref:hypothetical protein n=1 Tax=Pseudomonas syringae TaxID=317 RepID=UPI003B0018D4